MCVFSAVLVALGWLCAGLLSAAVWLWASRLRTSIPGPPTLPLLGNALALYKMPLLWDRFGQLHNRYGDIYRLYVGPKLVIVLTQPEDIQTVLLGRKPRSRDPLVRHVFHSFLGDGLLSTTGETWKRHRKNLEPTFHTEELEKYMEKFNNTAWFLCDQLAEMKGEELDVYRPLMVANFRAAVSNIFGIDFELMVPGRQRQAEVIDMIIALAEAVLTSFCRPWHTISLMKWFTAEGQTFRRFNTLAKYLIDRGIEVATKSLSGVKPTDRNIMTFLLKEKNSQVTFTEEEFRDEALTLIIAGVETVSTAMGYIFTALGLYPDWQDLAQRELDDYFRRGDDYLRAVTTKDLANLKVIDAIVKETGRLFTTVPCILYQVDEDAPLAGGRHIAPRGSTVLVAYYLMHRHPKLFPQPEKFDPGRFLEGGSATTRKAYSYLPFGLGAHQCIGARYAVLQMKVILATVLRRYRILSGASREHLEESIVGATSHPITGFRVTCVPRENVSSKSV